jgi:salicylate hydroxylase
VWGWAVLKGQQISVLGGGIAGLTSAVAMAQRGAKVRVFEQAAEISEVGAGLQISPNGFAVLQALGLSAALRDVSIVADGIRLRDFRHGKTVLSMPLQGLGHENPYLFVHRAALIDVLASAARDAGVEIILNHRVSAPMHVGPDADFTVAADGLHSWVRARLNNGDAPFFTGQVAWRAVVDDIQNDSIAQVWMGPGCHLVTYPLSGGLRNIVAVQERETWADEGWNIADDPENLQAAFAGSGQEIRELLGRVETVNLWGLFRHPVAEHWFDDHYALVGDAAHPTLPFLAQGANMALEDAWVLADCLASMDRPQALQAYQNRRKARVTKVIAAANANARNFHLRNPLVRFGAHTGLRLAAAIAPLAVAARFDWIYQHDVTGG